MKSSTPSKDEPPLVWLVREADEALNQTVQSVLNKRGVAPSGDRHDYYSVGRYYWPPDGDSSRTPWIHRDGEVSPYALKEGDFPAWNRMGYIVETLGLAWNYTREERYAEKAVQWLKCWFSDKGTRMTPHFRYSATAPGHHDGGGIGLIEAVETMGMCLNGMSLLRESSVWSPDLQQNLDLWLDAFLGWVITDPKAEPALKHKNNIGTWSEVLVASIGLYRGNKDLVRERASCYLPQRIAMHLEPDGSQPAELRRTLSFHYSCYHLEAFLRWMELAEKAGKNFWGYSTPDGRSVRKGLLFLLKNQPWPYPDFNGANLGSLLELVSFYFKHTGKDQEIEELVVPLREIPHSDRFELLAGNYYLF